MEYIDKYGKPEAGDVMVTGVGTLGVCYVVKPVSYTHLIEEYAERAGDARLLGFSHYYKGRTYYLSNETGKVFEEIGEALGYLEPVSYTHLLRICRLRNRRNTVWARQRNF